MRPQPQTITLGEQAWLVRPLTCAQVQAIEPLLFASTDGRGTVAAALAILRVALNRDHAEASAGLNDVEAGAPEIATALAGVLRLGGFVPLERAQEIPLPGKLGAGETPAHDPQASTGAFSTPG